MPASMPKESWQLWPIVIALLGLLTMASPEGKIPRIPFLFGEYKYVVGILLIGIAAALYHYLSRRIDRDR